MTRAYPCACGCGVVTYMGSQGRPRKYATPACRLKCERKVRFLACTICGSRFVQTGKGYDRSTCSDACRRVKNCVRQERQRAARDARAATTAQESRP